MTRDRISFLASAIVLWTGCLWGFYWLPVRALDEMGVSGPWGTLCITLAATVLLAGPAFVRRAQILKCDRVALASILLGGGAFALYSIGFLYGRVALIILLWFLTPVWSTLIGRYVMGWHTPRLRIFAIVAGIAGLMVMLSAGGSVPLPRGLGEWMSLIAGVLWAISTTGIRAKSDLDPLSASFVFTLGASAAALAMALVLAPMPVLAQIEQPFAMTGLALFTGAVWWGASLAGLMWAAVRLDPARVGILLMSEVVIGAVSAAVLAGEHLVMAEIIGGALVLCAGVLEIWPQRRENAPPAP